MGAAATAAAGEAGRAPWAFWAGRAGVRGGRPGPPLDAVCCPQSAAPREMEPRAEAQSRREAQEARRRRGPREAGGRGPPGQVGPECGAGVGRPGVPRAGGARAPAQPAVGGRAAGWLGRVCPAPAVAQPGRGPVGQVRFVQSLPAALSTRVVPDPGEAAGSRGAAGRPGAPGERAGQALWAVLVWGAADPDAGTVGGTCGH